MSNALVEQRTARANSFRRFLQGGPAARRYLVLDPSSYAAEFAGKYGGHATLEDNVVFQEAFGNDCPILEVILPENYLPELKWDRRFLRESGEERYFEETLRIPAGRVARRILAEKKGTIPWLVESAVQKEPDFDLVDYYADCVQRRADWLAAAIAPQFDAYRKRGFMVGAAVLIGFEAYYLIDYPAQPIFFYDMSERYLASIRKVQEANMVLIRELAKVGCEIVGMGSAGLELLSPRIFDEAIISFARETTDLVRSLGMFSHYHICGHSRQLLESGRINTIHPTWFETVSTPPCGDNVSLSEGLKCLSPDIISKGNLPLESLRNGTPEDIRAAIRDIIRQSAGRRHIIGQADSTILPGTPIENVRAFAAEAAE
jgi:uroporphyrinogen-III decarboxylase